MIGKSDKHKQILIDSTVKENKLFKHLTVVQIVLNKNI